MAGSVRTAKGQIARSAASAADTREAPIWICNRYPPPIGLRCRQKRASDFERLKGQLQTLVADAIQKAEERLPSYKKLRALHRIQAWFVPIGSALVSGLGIVSIANLNNPAISGAASLAAVLVSVAVGTYGSFKPASDAEYSLLRLGSSVILRGNP